MALTGIEQVRFSSGDTEIPYHLTDLQIQDYIDLNNGNIERATADVMQIILVAISTSTGKDRIGDLWTDNTRHAQDYQKMMNSYVSSSGASGARPKGPSVRTLSPFSIGMFDY